jgi:hypothetical protein
MALGKIGGHGRGLLDFTGRKRNFYVGKLINKIRTRDWRTGPSWVVWTSATTSMMDAGRVHCVGSITTWMERRRTVRGS